jgi:myosin heavy subunit
MNKNAITIKGLSEVSFSLVDSAKAERNQLLDESREIKTISDSFDAVTASDLFKRIQLLKKETETARKEVKGPIDEIAKSIQKIASEFIAPVQQEYERLRIMLGEYERMESDRRSKEEEAARKQAEEIHRVKIEEAKAEAARLEAENRKLMEEAQSQINAAKEKAKASGLDEKAAEIEVMTAIDEKQEELLSLRDEALDGVGRAVEATSKALTSSLGAGTGVRSRSSFEFTVDNYALLYASHPECVKMDSNKTVILALLKQGVKLPGVSSWQVNKAY